MKAIIKKILKKKTIFVLLLFSAMGFVGACGGGGGGGGGGTVVDPPPESGYVTLSSISPSSGSVIAENSTAVAFNTDNTASCRWSLQDLGYDAMSSSCSGSGTRNHSCPASNLVDGPESVYVACAPGDGDKDTAQSNENITYTVDTADPEITMVYPGDGSEFHVTALPSRAEISYSDASSGVDPSSIQVSFVVKQRTLSLTDLFGMDPVANASSSRTDTGNADPFQRTSVAQGADFPITNPENTWTFDRTGEFKLRLAGVDSTRFFAWDISSTGGSLIDVQSEEETVFAFPAAPLSVVVSGPAGKLYSIFANDDRLHIYSLSDPGSSSTQNLPGSPNHLSLDPLSDVVQISYSDLSRVDAWNCANSSIESTIYPGHSPYHLAAVPGNSGEVVTVAAIGGGIRLFKTDSTGTKVNALLGLQYPKRLLVDASGVYAFVSLFSEDRVVAVNLATAAKSEIAVGTAPNALLMDESGNLLCMNSGDATVSSINTADMSVSPPVAVAVSISDGLYLPGAGGAYVLAEDIWNIDVDTPVSLSASIADFAGRRVSGSADFSVNVTVLP